MIIPEVPDLPKDEIVNGLCLPARGGLPRVDDKGLIDLAGLKDRRLLFRGVVVRAWLV